MSQLLTDALRALTLLTRRWTCRRRGFHLHPDPVPPRRRVRCVYCWERAEPSRFREAAWDGERWRAR